MSPGSVPPRRSGGLAARINPYWLMIAPAVLVMGALYLLPVLNVLAISVTEPEPGLGNYVMLVDNAPMHRVILATLRVAAITTALALLLGYFVAYGLATASPRMRGLLMIGVVLPLWVSVLIRSFSWIAILRRQGVLNTWLVDGGLVERPLDLLYNELAVCIGMVHFMLPYAILPLYASMRGIDGRLIAAAYGLGASRLRAFLTVFLPLSAPGIVGAGVLVFIFSLGFFVTPAILGGGRIQMIAEYMSWLILDRLLWGPATMLATVLVLAILVLLAALSRVVDLRKLFGAA